MSTALLHVSSEVISDDAQVSLLEQRVRQLEQRLAETERVYALGVLATGAARELRNPIAAVATSLSLLRDSLASLHREGGFDLTAIDTLQEMALTVADARQGIQCIADISRGMELSQRHRDSEQDADLAEVMRLTLATLQGELQRCARLSIELGHVPRVRGSRALLGQLVLNLMVHALQGLAGQSARESQLRIALCSEGKHVRLDVEERAGAERLSAGLEGAMPLTASRKIVEELGGTMRVVGSTGGRCFSVLLPSVEASTSAA